MLQIYKSKDALETQKSSSGMSLLHNSAKKSTKMVDKVLIIQHFDFLSRTSEQSRLTLNLVLLTS